MDFCTFKPFLYDNTSLVYPADSEDIPDLINSKLYHKGIQIKKQGNKGRKTRNYIDIFACFDIETTNIAKLKQNIMYVWQFQLGEDLTIIGRTWEQYLKLLEIIGKNLKEDTWLVIYDHNLSYEFQYLKGIYPFEAEEVFAMSSRHVLKCDMFKRFEYRCSYYHSNMNLDTFTNKMKAKHVKQSGDDFDYSIQRFPWTRIRKNEFPYIINDVLGLHEALTNEMELDGDNLTSIPLTSTGYVRRDVKRSMQPIMHSIVHKILPDLEVINLLEECFRGGDTHGNRWFTGQKIKKVKSKDRSSSYPDVQLNRPMPMSRFIHVAKSDTNNDKLYQLIDAGRAVIFRIDMYNVRLKDNTFPNPYIAKAKCRKLHNPIEDNGRVLSADYLQTSLTDIDFKIISEIYDFDMDVYDIYFARYGDLPEEYKEPIRKLYRDKTELKDVAGQEVFYTKQKNKLNAVYGMSAMHVIRQLWTFLRQMPTDKSRESGGFDIDKSKTPEEQLEKAYRSAFSTYAWGCYTTAWARYELYLGQKLIHNTPFCQLLYWDTDSLKYTGDADFSGYNLDKVNSSTKNYAYATDKNGKTHFMGVFEDDGEYLEFKYLGAKKYCYYSMDKDKKTGEFKKTFHITIAGVNKSGGVKELEELAALERINTGDKSISAIDMFKAGTRFTKSAGIEALYNDLLSPTHATIQRHNIDITSNVYFSDGEYTLNIKDDYEQLIEWYSMQLIEADMYDLY